MIKAITPISAGFGGTLQWSASNFTDPYEILIRGGSSDIGAAQKALPMGSKFEAYVTWADGTMSACWASVISAPKITANGEACRFSSIVRKQPAKRKAAGEITHAELGAILNAAP